MSAQQEYLRSSWLKRANSICAYASGVLRLILLECMATVGQVGNEEHENVVYGKAGRTRWLGIRPHVRGMIMNPVDHPMGGGEGKSKSHKHPVSPWGTPAKGYRTRKRKPSDVQVRRRKKLTGFVGGNTEMARSLKKGPYVMQNTSVG